MTREVAELLFVETVRRYVETLPEGQTGWLAGLRDTHVARALALLRRDIARPWTVDRGRTGPRGGSLAVGAGRPLHPPDRRTANALSSKLAHAGSDAKAALDRTVRPQRAGRVFEQLGFELLPAEPGAFVFANNRRSRAHAGRLSGLNTCGPTPAPAALSR
jgi:hypothetical protein